MTGICRSLSGCVWLQVRAQAKALAVQRVAAYQSAMAVGQQEAVGQLEAAWEAERAQLAANLAHQHRQVYHAMTIFCGYCCWAFSVRCMAQISGVITTTRAVEISDTRVTSRQLFQHCLHATWANLSQEQMSLPSLSPIMSLPCLGPAAAAALEFSFWEQAILNSVQSLIAISSID